MTPFRSGMIGAVLVAFAGQSPAQLQLTPEQKTIIYDAVRPGDGRVKAPGNVPVTVGAQVPPATELYFLPDSALATAPEAKSIKYTVAQNRVVLVDPTTMRVVDVISQH